MAHRAIVGLKWARPLPARPSCVPLSRPRGAKAAGLRYEKALAAALPFARRGQWFEYQDAGGLGYCQPDLLMRVEATTVVVEVKYTWVREAESQLRQLYVPVLEEVTQGPVRALVACRKLVPGIQRPIARTLEEALALALEGEYPVWHWIGAGSIGAAPPFLMPERLVIPERKFYA